MTGPHFQHQGVAVELREGLGLRVAIPEVATGPQNAIVGDLPGGRGRSSRWIITALITVVLGGAAWWTVRGLLPEAATEAVAIVVPERPGAPDNASGPLATVVPPGIPETPIEPVVLAAPRPTDSELVARRARRGDPRARTVTPMGVSRRPSVILEYVVGTRELSEVEVRAAIVPLQEQLRRCHGEAIERGQVADRRIIVDLTVRGATVVAIAPRAGARSPRLWSCLRGVLLSARFGRAPAYAEASITLRLGSP